MKRLAILIVMVIGVGYFVLAQWSAPRPGAQVGEGSPTALLSGAVDPRFSRAIGQHKFVFPLDHGPHRNFQSEWWYFTGNLVSGTGQRFGFQLTFFRFALDPIDPTAPPRESAWAVNDIYEAHFALTDISKQRFYASSRSSRAALDIAGAQPAPFRVWIDDWSVEADADASTDIWPMRLQASSVDVGIELLLMPLKQMVLQGDAGLSQKSAQPGNASYYYSYPRVAAHGSVRVGSEKMQVEGLTWFDREWSTSSLAKDQLGWDWLSVQFEDGSDFMFYRLRLRDGTVDSRSAGVWIDPQGIAEPLNASTVDMIPTDWWTSDTSGVKYPLSWKVLVKQKNINFVVAPLLAGQEWRQRFRYWEGAVSASGSRPGLNVLKGSGYLELVGYSNH